MGILEQEMAIVPQNDPATYRAGRYAIRASDYPPRVAVNVKLLGCNHRWVLRFTRYFGFQGKPNRCQSLISKQRSTRETALGRREK
jgi:hypothetical protein